MQVPGLAEDRYYRRAGFHQRAHIAVFLHRVLGETRGAEGGQPRVIEIEVRGAREKLFVLRIRPGPAALDEIDAQIVQLLRNRELVLHRERDGLALRSVAEGRIESEDFHRGTREPGRRRVTAPPLLSVF